MNTQTGWDSSGEENVQKRTFWKLKGNHENNIGLKRFFYKQALTRIGNETVTQSRPIHVK
jgi:hypothetical protein